MGLCDCVGNLDETLGYSYRVYVSTVIVVTLLDIHLQKKYLDLFLCKKVYDCFQGDE